MNKAELIDELTKKLDADRKTATEAVELIVDTIVRAVNRGESVTITGFGVFEKRRRAPRVARNPRTGETVKVRATSVPAFRPGAQFKAVVAGKQKLSATGPAVKRGSGAGTTTAAKKTAAKKAPAKKTAAKKAPAKKTAAKKAPAKTTATKTAAKKAPAKTTAAKKTAAKKAPAKKTAAKKASAKKTAAKKAPAKKTTRR
ncbi:HU family DNA-binding protein [Gordonia sp. i37]|uniref:HU family DNA-binding protein n=1 Tax=Gordonia sp. i37 TaxID=1961707 RepID=UPI0009AEF5FF|nr:HU family DNA-binding protein [Gordonia sp. i37]OPX14551.1 DNA-binding protein [Gordonia sp. i37]